jgi:hypothetical protein
LIFGHCKIDFWQLGSATERALIQKITNFSHKFNIC